MEIRKPAALVATALLFAVPTPVLADGHEAGPGATMVHARTCNFNDRQDMGDLERVIDDWNEWADNRGISNYLALTMTPNFHGAETFDVGWIGVSQGGEALGEAFDMWAAEGGDLAERFAEVVTCDTHGMFLSVESKPASNPEPPDNVVVAFHDCKMTKGTSSGQFWQALGAWTEYMTENGYPQGQWIWYPAFGGGDVDYDFKMVQGFENHAAVGKSFDLWMQHQSWRSFEVIMEPVVECDDARVYDATVQRRPAID